MIKFLFLNFKVILMSYDEKDLVLSLGSHFYIDLHSENIKSSCLKPVTTRPRALMRGMHWQKFSGLILNSEF